MESSDLISGASETGSLTAYSNQESQFVGSSSGVYFVNTVRQAFSKDLNQSRGCASSQSGCGLGFPPPEDTLVGSEDSPRDKDKQHRQHALPPPSFAMTASPSATGDGTETLSRWMYAPEVAAQLGQAPQVAMARDLMMAYFKVWHPLFPFLHGPTFLQAMELLYSGGTTAAVSPTASVNTRSSPSHDHRNACWTTIFQCVFNLASLLRPDLHLPAESQIESSSSVYPLLGTLSCRHDLSSLQALLAAQLYLVATMSLRTASTVGGCVLRSMLHAGLHRCPFRYKELSSHDRQLRKRIFWCAYAIDRYLSQVLGLPLGIQDSDIDVCPPGAQEVHAMASPARTGPSRSENTPGEPQGQCGREVTLASYVESGKLTGRALELFHKSITVRSIRRSSILFLTSDVHKWWNSLPRELQSSQTTTSSTEKLFNFAPFFTVLYHHLILLINRPFLSLSPSSPEFCSALQTCIGAARGILTALRGQVEGHQGLFWPGFLSAAWMSGLVLAFACQLRQYVLEMGYQEISECLGYLHIMSTQWETANHCHSALSALSANIRHSMHSSVSGLPAQAHVPPTTETDNTDSSNNEDRSNPPSKKRRLHQTYPADEAAQTPPTTEKASHIPHSTTSSSTQGQSHYPASMISTSSPAQSRPAPDPFSTSHYNNDSDNSQSQFPNNANDITAAAATTAADIDYNHAPTPLLYFPDTQPPLSSCSSSPSLPAVGNFDLNMGDLLAGPASLATGGPGMDAGAGFDSFLDLFGGQFPGF